MPASPLRRNLNGAVWLLILFSLGYGIVTQWGSISEYVDATAKPSKTDSQLIKYIKEKFVVAAGTTTPEDYARHYQEAGFISWTGPIEAINENGIVFGQVESNLAWAELVVVYEYGKNSLGIIGINNASFAKPSDLAKLLKRGQCVTVRGGPGEIERKDIPINIEQMPGLTETVVSGKVRTVEIHLNEQPKIDTFVGLIESITRDSLRIKNDKGESVSAIFLEKNMPVETITASGPSRGSSIAISDLRVGDSVSIYTTVRDGKRAVVSVLVRR